MSELADRIRAFQEERFPTMKPEVRALLQGTTDDLVRSGIAELSLRTGDQAPDFALPDVHGEIRKLSDMLSNGPVVVAFYRGQWCPYCNMTLRTYQERLGEMQALGGQLVAVSPQMPDHSLSTAERNELTFEVLSDEGNRVAREYRLVYPLPDQLRSLYLELGADLKSYNGDSSWELPMPGTFVVAPDGRIQLAFVDAEYRHRLEPSAILEALRAIQP